MSSNSSISTWDK